jgi:hypothetical protein
MFASAILSRVRIILQDTDSQRWSLPELLYWLNDAQRELVQFKPSALVDSQVIYLIKGTRQKLPNDAALLLGITRNIAGAESTGERIAGPTIRLTTRDMLDALPGDWHVSAGASRFRKQVQHYAYDKDEPRAFYVFPGNTGDGAVEALVSLRPTDLAVASGDNPSDIDSYDFPIALEDGYAPALVDYVCYRAYSKDAQYVGETQRAALHYQQFTNAIGTRAQIEASVSPNIDYGVKYAPAGASAG